MKRFFSSFRIVWLFCLSPWVLPAQESDIYKRMLKETLRPDILLDFSLDFSDFVFLRESIRLDATKEYLPRLSFNYKQNLLLLSYKEDFTFPKPLKISPLFNCSLFESGKI
jgi:hypothetical protein